jgi:hypothetical protein
VSGVRIPPRVPSKESVHATGFLLGNSRSEFRTRWGSGAKEPRAGIYSEHGDCALHISNHPSKFSPRMIQYKQMSNIKTYNSILSKLVIVFPLILIVSLYTNNKTGSITPVINFLDALLLPSLIGSILSAVLLKVTSKKLKNGSSTISNIALIIALIAVE